MFIFQDRNDYREYLEHLLKMLQGQRSVMSRKKDLDRVEHIQIGINMALDALAEWEKQQPDTKLGEP